MFQQRGFVFGQFTGDTPKKISKVNHMKKKKTFFLKHTLLVGQKITTDIKQQCALKRKELRIHLDY
jgi:hypothetical protein